MKTILAILLSVSCAWGFSASQVVLPTYAGTDTQQASATANQIKCSVVVAPFDISFTKLTWGVTTAAVGALCSVALYPDTDGGSLIFGGTPQSCAGNGPHTQSGVAAIVGGTRYRICACSTATGTRLLTAFDFSPAGMSRGDVLNKDSSPLKNGIDNTQTCTGGTLPLTAGTLTASTDESLLVVLE